MWFNRFKISIDRVTVFGLFKVFILKCMIAIQTIFTPNDRPAPFPAPTTTKIEAAITVVRR